MQEVRVVDLGTVDYNRAWQLQEKLLQNAVAQKAAWHTATPPGQPYAAPTCHYLLLCRHPHVYTLGKSGKDAHLLANEVRLQSLGAIFVRTNRGGDITYHGPGQLVAYPVLDLEYFFTDLGRYMRTLEDIVIQTLEPFGIHGNRLPGATGVWLDPDSAKARKICAMGVRSSRWVTMHGLALNMNTDLSFFNQIVPCGISDKGVTSMARELGQPVDEQMVEERFLEAFARTFDAQLKVVPTAGLWAMASAE